MLRNQDLNLLPIFDALIREQHLSRAAERLSMSQPAVSSALKRLRLSFRDDLFVRTGRGLKPTPRALEIHDRLAPLLAEISDTYGEPDFDAATFTRTISISMNTAAEFIAVPKFLRRLRGLAPQLTLKLQSDLMRDIPTQLKDGRLTFAVDYQLQTDEDFDSVELNKSSLMAICASDNPLVGTKITLQGFSNLAFVAHVPRDYTLSSEYQQRSTPLEHLMRELLPTRNIAVYASNHIVIPEIVAETDLVGIVPTALALPYLEQGRLKELQLPFEFPELVMKLYWHSSRSNDPAHQWIIEQIIAASQGA